MASQSPLKAPESAVAADQSLEKIPAEQSTVAPISTLPLQPLPYIRLKQIAKDACDSTFSNVSSYDHSRALSWNENIINTILRALRSETSKPPSNSPPFKFVVQATVIQHQGPLGSSQATSMGGRRGMLASCGAYWNEQTDGMWNYMYDAGAKKGFNVVISVIWITV